MNQPADPPISNVNVIRQALNWHIRASIRGGPMPSNPHNFTPDETNSLEQLTAHREACEAFDAGEYKPGEDKEPWGPGVHSFDRPEMLLALEALEVLEGEVTGLRKAVGATAVLQLMRDANRYVALRTQHVMTHKGATAEGFDKGADLLIKRAG